MGWVLGIRGLKISKVVLLSRKWVEVYILTIDGGAIWDRAAVNRDLMKKDLLAMMVGDRGSQPWVVFVTTVNAGFLVLVVVLIRIEWLASDVEFRSRMEGLVGSLL